MPARAYGRLSGKMWRVFGTPAERHLIPYFDGLRGAGALVVLLGHLAVTLYPSLTTGNNDASGVHLLTRVARSPLDLFTSANFAVGIFFVLSGYVMALLVCQSRENVLGLCLRRYIRLDGPALASCLISAALLAAGLYWNQRVAAITGSTWLTQWFSFPGSFSSALREGSLDIFQHPTSAYNANLWTMYTELWGSFAIYAVHRTLMWRLIRFSAFTAIAIIAFVVFRDYGFFCIFAGSSSFYLRDFLRADDNTGPISARYLRLRHALQKLHGPAIALPAIFIGLYFGSYPDFGSFGDAGWVYSWLRASSGLWVYFYHALGAVLIVHFIHGASGVRTFLGTSPMLYLGRVSFPLYLIHLPIICSFSSWLIGILHTRLAYNAMAIVVITATIIVCFGAAEIFGRAIDRPCLELSRRLSRRLDLLLRKEPLLASRLADH